MTYAEQLLLARRRIIEEALAATHGNVTVAAGFLDLHRSYMYELMRKVGIKRHQLNRGNKEWRALQ